MKTDKAAATPVTKVASAMGANVDQASRTVTFVDRPRFAIQPVSITVPFAAVKAICAAILSHEAQVEMGGGIQTQVTAVPPVAKE